jgi:hypothetical protein
MPICPHCGHDTTDSEARFCAACGRSLNPADQGESAAETTSMLQMGVPEAELPGPAGDDTASESVVERLQRGTALLVVRRGPASGARFLLDADVTTAGRHPDSDIFLDDITVSRHHLEFRRTGTYVNRTRIDEQDLVSGDEVQIGKYRLQFLSAAGSAGGEA